MDHHAGAAYCPPGNAFGDQANFFWQRWGRGYEVLSHEPPFTRDSGGSPSPFQKLTWPHVSSDAATRNPLRGTADLAFVGGRSGGTLMPGQACSGNAL
jgi:hypothetical protein